MSKMRLRSRTRSGNLGEPLYRKQEPTGYSNLNAEWVNSAALLARMNFALALAQNKVPGVKVDASKFAADEPSEIAQALLSARCFAANESHHREGGGGSEGARIRSRRAGAGGRVWYWDRRIFRGDRRSKSTCKHPDAYS